MADKTVTTKKKNTDKKVKNKSMKHSKYKKINHIQKMTEKQGNMDGPEFPVRFSDQSSTKNEKQKLRKKKIVKNTNS